MSEREDDLRTLGIEHAFERLDPDGYGWAAGDGPSAEEVVGALIAAGWRPPAHRGSHDFDNHGPTDNLDCPGCVAPETPGDQP
ncbi:hypothetical protein FB382_004375 [Nocardioides ginsengisegetis]|uniref:Uncharacterized protein n=1 Tax=Nocardioides ginsengisegetis TaxID=661491 RepID=A0A7W3PC14_9ACTN|nr:hypothetical protein [Nocardioides ginsengisegetis]MBA8805600.1 hypothetical protein [Nocardioides ginsengisegetis]MBA8806024.1 hypothetical protein [Nocardioides ginsengisegetis]